MDRLIEVAIGIAAIAGVIAAIVGVVFLIWRFVKRDSIPNRIKRHFSPHSADKLSLTERQFPSQIRADLQRALDAFLETVEVVDFFGVPPGIPGFGGVDFIAMLDDGMINFTGSNSVSPPQYEQIDVGEDEPVLALQNGLWLLNVEGFRCGLLYAPVSEMGDCGKSRMRLQMAVIQGEGSEAAIKSCFEHFESAVETAQSYRGKVLSLEQGDEYSGQSSGVKVHRLAGVPRDAVILPSKTLDLLDRNLIHFVSHRNQLRAFKMATKKGVLFYGPPGTGKTHTIRYLAGSLQDHTTLLIAAEQIGLLSDYMTLARLLQPSIVVIEDVDLIARERTQMRNASTELVLNKLLNEMDGLREDCEIVFILTTNRPETLEGALASRPGRIDQAIEFPLPDQEGRAKLLRLYAGGVDLPDAVAERIVRRTNGVSASFIKELMRRAAQFHLAQPDKPHIDDRDVENALDEMLFSGRIAQPASVGRRGMVRARRRTAWGVVESEPALASRES